MGHRLDGMASRDEQIGLNHRRRLLRPYPSEATERHDAITELKVAGGPRVRILFPPAASQQRTVPAVADLPDSQGTSAGFGCADAGFKRAGTVEPPGCPPGATRSRSSSLRLSMTRMRGLRR